jgi:hypothetical protein
MNQSPLTGLRGRAPAASKGKLGSGPKTRRTPCLRDQILRYRRELVLRHGRRQNGLFTQSKLALVTCRRAWETWNPASVPGRLYRKLNSLGHNLPCSIALALLKVQLHSGVGGCLICLALKLD